jgi:hypothetical protein
MFIFTHLKETIDRTMSEASIKRYNQNISDMFDNFKVFLLIHYLNGRKDSEFWINANRLVAADEKIQEIVEISKIRLLNKSDLNYQYGGAGAELFNWILCGLGHYTPETAALETKILDRKNIASQMEEKLANELWQHKWLSNESIIEAIRGHNAN